VDTRHAETIDILPTIADALGIRLPWPVDGRSLRAKPVARTVSVGSRNDPPVRAGTGDVAAEVLGVARRNAALFGVGNDSMYRIGPRPDLLGRPVSSLPQTSAAGSDVSISRQLDLANVRRSSGYVPAQILGRISWDGLRAADVLAIAVNGRVAATTKPYSFRGATEFSSMIDEAVLHDGRNTVGVYAVRGSGAETSLLALGGRSSSTPSALAAPG
jgi:hypothetical protein